MLRLKREQTPESSRANSSVSTELNRPPQRLAHTTPHRCWSYLTVICVLATAQGVRGDLDVVMEPIGNPTWRPGEIHVFTSRSDSFQNWLAVMNRISPPSEYTTPREPPYESVMADGLTKAGIHSLVSFGPDDIDGRPNGINMGMTLLPDPGIIGTSVRTDSGAIIPLNLLPIRHSTTLRERVGL